MNEKNFQTALQRKGLLFNMFFAPWCSHCQKLEPTWKELAGKLMTKEHVLISRLDCTNNVKICADNNVRFF